MQHTSKDVYGVNSMGESLRFVLSGFGGRQVLVVVWHPSVLKAAPFTGFWVYRVDRVDRVYRVYRAVVCTATREKLQSACSAAAEVIDNFHLHRPPMVWPSLGPQLARRGSLFFQPPVSASKSAGTTFGRNRMPFLRTSRASLDRRSRLEKSSFWPFGRSLTATTQGE